MRTFYQKFYQPRLIALILSIYGMGLRICTLASRPLSGDEIFQYKNSAGPLKPFWGHLHYGDHTAFPGGYLLTYPFVRLFGLNKWGLALPHLFVTAAGFYVLYLLCRRWLKSPTATLIVFTLFAVNQNLVYHGLAFRPYAVLPVLALGSLFLWDLVLTRGDVLRLPSKAGISLFFLFTAVYHAYGILILTLPFFYFYFTKENKSRLKSSRYILGILVLAAALWSWYASANLFGLRWQEGFYAPKNTFRYIPDPLTDTIGFLKGIIGNLAGCRLLYVLILGPGVVWLLPGKDKIRQAWFALWLIIMPLGLILLVDLRTHYWFAQRQFVWIMPYFALWTGWCWDTIFLFASHSKQ